MRAVTIAAIVCASAPVLAQPARSQKLVATLDGPAPRYVCIVADVGTCSAGELVTKECPQPLARLVNTFKLLPADALAPAGGEYAPQAPQATTEKLPANVHGAFTALGRAPTNTCAGMHAACSPKIQLSARLFNNNVQPHVTCSAANGAARDNSVAFIAVHFAASTSYHAVDAVALEGTTATLHFARDLDVSDYVYAEVVGGNYAPSETSAIGAHERIVIPLHPRCEPYTAELPPRSAEPLGAVTLAGGGAPTACVAEGGSASELQIQVPYATAPRSTLTVTSPTGTFEATWTEALPAKPLRLAVRTVDFAWHRDCLSGTWPAGERLPEPTLWNAACPKATVANAGVACTLAASTDDLCRYHCEVPEGIPPFALPANVAFERLRTRNGDGPPETVYAWTDTLHYTGEQLRGFVPYAERRVVVELDPARWADDAGDTLDEIQLTLPSGAVDRIDLSRRTDAGPSAWRAMPAPGITCTDRVRASVQGARLYVDKSFAVEGGRIPLGEPSQYLCETGDCRRLVLWLWTGGGLLLPVNERASEQEQLPAVFTHGSIGAAVEMYTHFRPGSFELDVSADVGRTAFATKTVDGNVQSFEEVTVTRANLRLRYQWWKTPARHYAAALGMAVAVPFVNENNDKVGASQLSMTAELGARFKLLRQHGAWLEFALGARLFERRRYFDDFTLDPRMFSERSLFQLYSAFRFRFRLG